VSAARVTHPGVLTTRAVTGALVKVAGVVAVLALWQVLSATGVLPSDSFPTVFAVVRSLGDELSAGRGWSAIGSTLAGWAIGFAIGAVAAIAVGMMIGLSRFAYRSTILVIEFMKTIPVIAILPLLLLQYGGTLKMEYILVAFGVFWPLVIQVVYGVRAMDPVARDTAEALRVTGVRRLTYVVLPSAAPFVATGLRIAAAAALIIAIIAELIGGAPGLGRDILLAENSGTSALPLLYALIVLTGALGIVLSVAFRLVERRLLRWHERFRPRATGFA
jgi:ABC-type nitrate/sulfonate/bicarbonate transport system permease component